MDCSYKISFKLINIVNYEVSKYTLDKEDFKKRFKQIVGFHFVSSKDYTGIAELTKDLIDVTLKQKYIGEAIPVNYFLLNFHLKMNKIAVKFI
jgi:hypothetical protein